MKDKIKKDQRFLAQWTHDAFWYPATVVAKDKDRDASLYVRFDNGDKQWCTGAQLLPIDIEINDRIHALGKDEEAFFPARVTKINGDKYAITYDDKSQEWTTLARMRVTR